MLSQPDTFLNFMRIVPTDVPLVIRTSPVTPDPALLGIDGIPSANPILPLPLKESATTFDVASHKISVCAATDHATPVIDVLGSVAAHSAAEASNRLAALFVPVVVTFKKYSKSESIISCNATAIIYSYIDNISFSK